MKKSILPVLVCSFALLGSQAKAATIFQDGFSGSGGLNGRTPDGADFGGVGWSYTGYSGTFSVGSDSLAYTGSLDANFASLSYSGINFLNGGTYTVSLDLTLTNPDGDVWTGLGFTTGSPGAAFTQGAAWMLDKGVGGDVQYFANLFEQAATSAGSGASPATLQITLTLDGVGAGSLNYYIGTGPDSLVLLNSSPFTLTSSQVDQITGVGLFAYKGASGTIDNFTFSGPVSVPEPSVGAMISLGLGILLGSMGIKHLRGFRAGKAV